MKKNQFFNPINYDKDHIDIFNYKTDDVVLNRILSDVQNEIADTIDKSQIKFESDFKLNTLQPIKVHEQSDKFILDFLIKHKSNIFSERVEENKINNFTKFSLTQMKNIEKDKFAYVTLMFPNYKNGERRYDYLIPGILVAYMLKTQKQNVEKKQGTKAQIISLVTPDVDREVIDVMEKFYDKVIVVPFISWIDEGISGKDIIKIFDVSKGKIGSSNSYSKVFTKLHIFNSEILPFEKIVFLDLDLFPIGYFDTLFSLDTPAGCIEHRRSQFPVFGVDSWGLDRGQFFSHGELIPNMFTDVENLYSSDINASLLIVKPDLKVFKEIISHLQDDIFLDSEYKGIWLGNFFHREYLLPEQNYLTKKFSGEWHSVDLGFSTWSVDLENCFGFTFAGFVVKPWEIQSLFQKYSTNPYSTFSKINNKSAQRSLGYQFLNYYLSKLFDEQRSAQSEFSTAIQTLKKYFNLMFISTAFDPWEPEFDLTNIIQISYKTILLEDSFSEQSSQLSFDQKVLIRSILQDEDASQIATDTPYLDIQLDLKLDSILVNISKHIYNPYYIALSYHLANIFIDICNLYSIRIFPFGNTFSAIKRFKCFDICDDDNDFLIVINNDTVFKNIIKSILSQNLQVYICTVEDNKYIQIIRDDIKPVYYFNNPKNMMTVTEFCNTMTFSDVKYFNFSFYSTIIDKIEKDFNIRILDDMLDYVPPDVFKKVPWIDVFFLLPNTQGTSDSTSQSVSSYILNKSKTESINFEKRIFDNKGFLFRSKTTKINIINKNISIQKTKPFLASYYKDEDKLKSYKIKSKHQYNKERSVVFNLDLTNPTNNHILHYLFISINKFISDIYKSININNYL